LGGSGAPGKKTERDAPGNVRNSGWEKGRNPREWGGGGTGKS